MKFPNLPSRLRKAVMRRLLSPRDYLAWRYEKRCGHPLNLEEPETLMEKVHWIKLHCDLSVLSPFVDKHAVRDFVRERGGAEYLVPLVAGPVGRFDEIDREALPKSFVMKATHGCGWNVVVPDKGRVRWPVVRWRMNRWLARNYADVHGEENYRRIPPRVVVEAFLGDPSTRPWDYKFYCGDGEVAGAYVNAGRSGEGKFRFFDPEWREMEPSVAPPPGKIPEIPRPERLDEMLSLCKALSRGIPFVRVDLYFVDGRVYFGEMTFTPANGFWRYDPYETGVRLGSFFDVERFRDWCRAGAPRERA